MDKVYIVMATNRNNTSVLCVYSDRGDAYNYVFECVEAGSYEQNCIWVETWKVWNKGEY